MRRLSELVRSSAAVALILAIALVGAAPGSALAQEPSVSKYGTLSPAAPPELGLFAFLVGEWEGTAHAPAPDGNAVAVPVKWIGRYVLDGMAIADEIHSLAPDGKPAFGITLRHFDSHTDSWIVEFLNVTHGSFVRRQVNPRSGAVEQDGSTVMVTGSDGDTVIREQYRLSGDDRFTYSLAMSSDGGATWSEPSVEMEMTRRE